MWHCSAKPLAQSHVTDSGHSDVEFEYVGVRGNTEGVDENSIKLCKQSWLSGHSPGIANKGTRQLQPVTATSITVGQFRHHSMSTPRAMPTYHCVTRTNLAAAASSKEAPTPTFPATLHQWTDVCCAAVNAAERCVCACASVWVCVCVCVSWRPHVCQDFRVGGGTILTLSGVLAWPWPRLQVPGPVRSVPHRIDTAGLGYDMLPLVARPTTRYKAPCLSISGLLDSSRRGFTVSIRASLSRASLFESHLGYRLRQVVAYS